MLLNVKVYGCRANPWIQLNAAAAAATGNIIRVVRRVLRSEVGWNAAVYAGDKSGEVIRVPEQIILVVKCWTQYTLAVIRGLFEPSVENHYLDHYM